MANDVASSSLRAYIGGGIGLVVCVLVFLFSPWVHYSPQGLYLPLMGSRPPVSVDSVKLYPRDGAPFVYQTLGNVRIELHSVEPTEQDQKAIVTKAKALAASVGGSGIIVDEFFHSLPPEASVLATGVLRGRVVVPMEDPIKKPIQGDAS